MFISLMCWEAFHTISPSQNITTSEWFEILWIFTTTCCKNILKISGPTPSRKPHYGISKFSIFLVLPSIRPLLVRNLFQLHRPHQIWLPHEYCHYCHYCHYYVRNSTYFTKPSQNYNSFWNTCIDLVNNAFCFGFLTNCKLIWSLNRNV